MGQCHPPVERLCTGITGGGSLGWCWRWCRSIIQIITLEPGKWAGSLADRWAGGQFARFVCAWFDMRRVVGYAIHRPPFIAESSRLGLHGTRSDYTTFEPDLCQHLWAHVRIVGGKTPTYRPATSPPGSRRTSHRAAIPRRASGTPDRFTVSAVMIDSVRRASYVAAVNTIDVTAPTGATFSGYSRRRRQCRPYRGVGHGRVSVVWHDPGVAISANNEKFYFRTGLSSRRQNPFGTYSATNGAPGILDRRRCQCRATKPSGLSPSGSILDLVPTMAVAFVDGNTNRGDYLNQYRIQTQRVSDSVSMWDATISSSSAEKDCGCRSRAIYWHDTGAGHAIPMAHSGLRPFRHMVGMVRLGHVYAIIAGDDNAGRYPDRANHHQPADLPGQMDPPVQHIYEAGSDPAVERVWGYDPQTGADYDIADVASAAAPGTLFSVSFANSGLSTLAQGTSISTTCVDMMARNGANGLINDHSRPMRRPRSRYRCRRKITGWGASGLCWRSASPMRTRPGIT